MIEAKETLIGNISSKKTLTGKINNAIEKVYPELEDIIITPTTEEQQFKSKKYGYNNINVQAVNNEIDENIKAENIKSGVSILGINGEANILNGEEITINPTSEVQEITPTAPKNGFTKVIVNAQSGVDINDYFIKTPTAKNIISWIKKMPVIDFSNLKKDAFYQLFEFAYNLEEVEIINAEQVSGSANYMFRNTTKLKSYIIDGNLKNCNSHNSLFSYSGIKEIKNIDTSNSTNLGVFASYCSNLTDIEELDGSKSVAFNNFCYGSTNLTNLGGIKNIGMAYLTTQSANYSLYGLSLASNTKLTHDSLMNVINNLYDIASIGVQPQKLTLGSTNLAKLTEEEIAIATNKGWTVS